MRGLRRSEAPTPFAQRALESDRAAFTAQSSAGGATHHRVEDDTPATFRGAPVQRELVNVPILPPVAPS